MRSAIDRLCFCSNNLHKFQEINALLDGLIKVVTLKEIGCNEELPETHDTIEENSKEKAHYVFNKYNIACFADDSGLEVEELQGEPGVNSAMYAGPQRNDEDNIDLLLKSMKGIKNRKAQFKTVISLVHEKGTVQFDGVLVGNIIEQRKGRNGFGYDSIFVPNGFSKTLGEMTLAEKNVISHRTLAIRKLINYLKEDT